MFADTSPSERAGAAPAAALERARGRVELEFRASARGATLRRLVQEGCAKARLPRVAAGAAPEAVLINTAGGFTGGDRLEVAVTAGDDAAVSVTTAACEKIYRSAGGAVAVETRLASGRGARLEWLPQETILFDRARYARRLDIDMAADAAVLAVEAVLFGRLAHGEVARTGFFRDRWRVRRDGRLAFADDTVLDGPVAAVLDRPAALNGGRALATLVYAAPDAEGKLDDLRAALADVPAEAGASVRDRLLVARFAAANGAALRVALAATLAVLRDGRPLPKVWTC